MNKQMSANIAPAAELLIAQANLDQARELYARAESILMSCIGDEPAKVAWLQSQLAERAALLLECERDLQALRYRDGLGLDMGADESHFHANPERCAEAARELGADAGALTALILRYSAELRAQTANGFKTDFLRDEIRDHRAALWAVYHAPALLEREEEVSEALIVWDDSDQSPASTDWVREGARVHRVA